MSRTKYMAAVVATGNLGFGVGVVATQVGLVVGAAATNLVLDCIIATKNAGNNALNKGISIEKAIEQRIYKAIEGTQELARNPTEKLTEHANAFLDIANSVTESVFGLPPAVEDTEASLKDRISFLAVRIASSLKARTNEFVVDPIHQQVNMVLHQLTKCLVLVDYLKQRQEWTYNKVNQLSTSMVEFRKEIEAKASRVKSSPGAVLLDIIRHYASKLNEQLAKLRERGAELLSTSMQKQVQAATLYVQQLDDTFSKAQSIDQVKQEVVDEAKQKMTEIAGWTMAVMMRAGQSPKAKQNGSVDADGGH